MATTPVVPTGATNFKNVAGPVPGLNTQVTNPTLDATNAQTKQAATDLTATPTTTGYTAEQAGSTGYTAQNQTANVYDAATRNASNWNLTPEQQTVQGQLQGIIASNSPLMQQAQTTALQQMNKRGLLNSSMAVGAGQQAVISQALPIASADAAAYQTQNKFNAEQANVAAAANQAATNEASKFGATAENVAAAANQAATNEASKFGASAANTAELSNVSATNRAAEFGASAENTAASQTATDINKNVNLMLDESMKVALANADSNTKIALQNIDATTRKDITDLEATYKVKMQATQSANEIFQQTTANISKIMENPDLTVAAKQAGVNMQKGYLKDAIDILSSISNIPDLTTLIDFKDVVS